MGFFSSIGDFIGGVAGGIGDAVGGVVDWVGDVGGDALGLVGDVAGGLMGMNSSNKATSTNSAYNNANLALAQASLDFQKQYARNRLQWAKEDAQKAGFHPMVAAGLAPTSFSPVQASFTPAEAQNFDWVGKAGQSLSYAASKAKTNKQQAEMWNYTLGSAQQQLRSLQLDNTLKELEIASMGARLKQQAGGPAAPDLNGGRNLVGGQGDSPVLGDAFVVRHIRDNDYDINFSKDYQGELGDEVGQLYNMVRKGTRENGAVWTDPKTGVAYVFNRSSGWWNRLDALSPEEAERLLGGRHDSAFGHMPLSSSHRMRNSYRYR